MRKRSPPELQSLETTPPIFKRPFNLFAKENRGLLLDVVVFFANIFLMRLMSTYVLGLFDTASHNDSSAQLILTLGCIGMWILPAAGSVLKRWHFHQRLRAEHKTIAIEDVTVAGCLFNPVFYFCLNLVVMAAIMTGVGQFLVGQKGMANGAIFVPSILLGLILTILQTYLVYRYLTPPKKPPTSGFLLSPESDFLGDVCFFLNMLLFQCAWNLLTLSWGRVSSFGEFIGRLFVLCFLALLVYFPPRMFYLAEDINRKRTWLTMLLANSPVIFRVLIGTNNQAGW